MRQRWPCRIRCAHTQETRRIPALGDQSDQTDFASARQGPKQSKEEKEGSTYSRTLNLLAWNHATFTGGAVRPRAIKFIRRVAMQLGRSIWRSARKLSASTGCGSDLQSRTGWAALGGGSTALTLTLPEAATARPRLRRWGCDDGASACLGAGIHSGCVQAVTTLPFDPIDWPSSLGGVCRRTCASRRHTRSKVAIYICAPVRRSFSQRIYHRPVWLDG